MIGVALAVATALVWGVSGLLGAVAARRVGGIAAAVWSFPIGLAMLAPALLVTGVPGRVLSTHGAVGAAGALVAVIGLGLAFRAGGEGHAGLASSVVSLEGVWAAAIAALIGRGALRPAALPLLAVVAVGFLLLPAPGRAPGGGHLLKALLLALAAGVGFGAALNAYGYGQDALGAVGQAVEVRAVGCLVVVLLLAARRLPSPRGALWPIAGVAAVEASGTVTYLGAAARVGTAVAAVIASQFALVTLALGRLVLGERISRRQAVGAALILAGVAAITIIQG